MLQNTLYFADARYYNVGIRDITDSCVFGNFILPLLDGLKFLFFPFGGQDEAQKGERYGIVKIYEKVSQREGKNIA